MQACSGSSSCAVDNAELERIDMLTVTVAVYFGVVALVMQWGREGRGHECTGHIIMFFSVSN